MRSRILTTAFAAAALCALTAAPAQADFGLRDLGFTFTDELGNPSMQAGSHPFAFTFRVGVNTTKKEGIEVPDEEARDILAQLPPGLLASPTAVPTCSAAEFAEGTNEALCPDTASLGVFDLVFGFGEPTEFKVPVYNLAPPPGKVLRLGFKPLGVPVVIDGGINPTPPYNAFADSLGISQAAFFYSGALTLWGDPVDEAHDAERGACASSDAADLCAAEITPKPFTLLPRSCGGPLAMQVKARSWQQPGRWLEPPDVLTPEAMKGCSALTLGPRIDSRLSTDSASSPAGLSFELDTGDRIESPAGLADSDILRSVVKLPPGVTLNPSQAEGLVGCSEARLALERADSAPGAGCPEASKVGTIESENPLLEGVLLRGSVYVAEPDDPATSAPGAENRFDALIAIYIVVKDPGLGINVIVAGRVEPDPETGRITAIFEEMPQVPLGVVRLRLREGARSPLVSPPGCGSYETTAEFTPSSGGPPVEESAGFEIVSGPGGGPCPPAGPPPFEPGFDAGSRNNAAGAYSPFSMRLTRRDGDADLTRFDADLPPGVAARLAGLGRCSERGIAAAKAKSGRAELASPSCPASSRIGTIAAGAGVGSELTYVPGSLYLAGPFAGAPVSAVAIVPAVAGPFDVGTVVVRQALRVNPRTGVVGVDGAASDPIPHILAGIPLVVRDVQVHVDRHEFTVNPTGCGPSAVAAQIWGGGGDPFSAADDSPATRQARYQAADCARLRFAPRMALRLKGGTRRGAFPALRLTYSPRAGHANLERLSLRFPPSEFIEQAHFRTICTRVQFAAGQGHGSACPEGSIYGRARVFTPLLAEPLEGPVFLRSSDNNLPDVVLALSGPPGLPVKVEVPTRIDSIRGGLRATLTAAPDLPVSKAVVAMRGGPKSLFVNSTNVCARKHRADVRLRGHNEKRAVLRPAMRAQCNKQRRAHPSHRRG